MVPGCILRACRLALDGAASVVPRVRKPSSKSHIREFCNLGYATACPHLPATRDCDAIRFCVASSSADQIKLAYACERSHAPIAHGTLVYDLPGELWLDPHPDPRIARLAASYLHAYRIRQRVVSI
jgi:hypothetical protein